MHHPGQVGVAAQQPLHLHPVTPRQLLAVGVPRLTSGVTAVGVVPFHVVAALPEDLLRAADVLVGAVHDEQVTAVGEDLLVLRDAFLGDEVAEQPADADAERADSSAPSAPAASGPSTTSCPAPGMNSAPAPVSRPNSPPNPRADAGAGLGEVTSGDEPVHPGLTAQPPAASHPGPSGRSPTVGSCARATTVTVPPASRVGPRSGPRSIRQPDRCGRVPVP